MSDSDYLHYEGTGRTGWPIDASALKGTELQKLRDIIRRGDDAVLGDGQAIVVAPSKHAEALKDARIKVAVSEFRKRAADLGRLSRFLQEPIAIEEDGKPIFLLLPDKWQIWERLTAPLRSPPPPPPPMIAQFVLPPILPEIHMQIAERIGKQIGAEIAASVCQQIEATKQLTEVFRRFTRDAALAAAAASMGEFDE